MTFIGTPAGNSTAGVGVGGAAGTPTINVARLDDLLTASQHSVRAINNLSGKLDSLVTATKVVHSGLYALPYTFGQLPTASTVTGLMAYVTDSNTNVWGATIAGGGANVVLAWSNGANWTVVGK